MRDTRNSYPLCTVQAIVSHIGGGNWERIIMKQSCNAHARHAFVVLGSHFVKNISKFPDNHAFKDNAMHLYHRG